MSGSTLNLDREVKMVEMMVSMLGPDGLSWVSADLGDGRGKAKRWQATAFYDVSNARLAKKGFGDEAIFVGPREYWCQHSPARN
jgi:hypothetical protein